MLTSAESVNKYGLSIIKNKPKLYTKYIIDDGASIGHLILSQKNETDFYEIDILVVSSARLNLCLFDGKCLIQGELLLCLGESLEVGAMGKILKDTIEITQHPNNHCGIGATILGEYKKEVQ